MSKALKAKDAMEAQEIVERTAKENMVSKVRFIETMEVGKVVRQGDIYIHRVPENHKRGDLLDSRQLALGESMGSRHVAEKPCSVFEAEEAPSWYNAGQFRPALLGPCLVSTERFVITHPEHAHVSLPAGTYQITHQRDTKSNDRVRD